MRDEPWRATRGPEVDAAASAASTPPGAADSPLSAPPPVPLAEPREASPEADLNRRAARQAVLAELGLRALGKLDLQTLLDDAVRGIAATLDIDTCTVLELQPGGDTLVVRAAVGWNEPIVGVLTVHAGKASHAGYTVLAREPVMVEDVTREGRFAVAPILERHGIKSGMTVPIHGRDRPYGVFGVQSKRRRTFSKEDVDYFQAAANVLASAIERRRGEEELRRSEESFRNLIEHAPEGILISQERVIRYVNRAMVAYLGYASAAELRGRSALDVVHPDDREMVSGRLQTLAASGLPVVPRELRFLRRDGTYVVAESIGVPIRFDGAPALAAMTRDVTERKKMQARLSLSERMTSLGTLAAGVAHEVNNPLSYLLGNLELISAALPDLRATCAGLAAPGSAPATPAQAEQLDATLSELAALIENAREGGERVRQLVSDLKSFSRHKGEDERSAVDVRGVIDSSINMTRNEIRHRAELVRDYQEVPRVMANEPRLGQVFLNLLMNAAQAIPDGAIHENRIVVSTRTDAAERVVIEVRDTGCGIPPEIQSRLFDPFFTTKAVGVGTGLGLGICHSIVSGYGGEISVESEVGKGSCFRVTLPSVNTSPTSARPAPVKADGPLVCPRGRVLVIDDEPFVAGMCRRMLAPAHEVEITTAASAALALIESGRELDVILCDLMMPDMNGMEFYKRLEQLAPHLLPRIVFLSGGAFSVTARQFRESVPNLFLDKPCSRELLLRTVAERVRALRSGNAVAPERH